MILYLNHKQNRIEAVLKRPDPHNPFKSYCEEIEVPDNFDITIQYLNKNNEPRIRELTVAELKEKLSYREKRFNGYPEVEEQLDMLWHAMNTGEFPKVESFYNAIKDIKDKYPKE